MAVPQISPRLFEKQEDQAFAVYERWRSGPREDKLKFALHALALSRTSAPPGVAQMPRGAANGAVLESAEAIAAFLEQRPAVPHSFDAFVQLWNSFVDFTLREHAPAAADESVARARVSHAPPSPSAVSLLAHDSATAYAGPRSLESQIPLRSVRRSSSSSLVAARLERFRRHSDQPLSGSKLHRIDLSQAHRFAPVVLDDEALLQLAAFHPDAHVEAICDAAAPAAAAPAGGGGGEPSTGAAGAHSSRGSSDGCGGGGAAGAEPAACSLPASAEFTRVISYTPKAASTPPAGLIVGGRDERERRAAQLRELLASMPSKGTRQTVPEERERGDRRGGGASMRAGGGRYHGGASMHGTGKPHDAAQARQEGDGAQLADTLPLDGWNFGAQLSLLVALTRRKRATLPIGSPCASSSCSAAASTPSGRGRAADLRESAGVGDASSGGGADNARASELQEDGSRHTFRRRRLSKDLATQIVDLGRLRAARDAPGGGAGEASAAADAPQRQRTQVTGELVGRHDGEPWLTSSDVQPSPLGSMRDARPDSSPDDRARDARPDSPPDNGARDAGAVGAPTAGGGADGEPAGGGDDAVGARGRRAPGADGTAAELVGAGADETHRLPGGLPAPRGGADGAAGAAGIDGGVRAGDPHSAADGLPPELRGPVRPAAPPIAVLDSAGLRRPDSPSSVDSTSTGPAAHRCSAATSSAPCSAPGSAPGSASLVRRRMSDLPVSFSGEMLSSAAARTHAASHGAHTPRAEPRGARCFSQQVVGTFSCHGMAPVEAEAVDKINQDCGCFVNPFAWPGQALFAVFDGHGRDGEVASNTAMSAMSELLADDARLEAEPEAALVDAFEHAEDALRREIPVEAQHSGAVAVAALLRHDRLIVAGAGDCRCVLARARDDGLPGFDTVQLSVEHNFENSDERARVLKLGGQISASRSPQTDGYFEPGRIYRSLDDPSLGPGLAMSRSIGDLDATEVGVVPTPDVRTHMLEPRDQFVILASDGVWEFIESDEAVQIVGGIYAKGWSAEAACKHLIARAAVAWMEEEGNHRDDITCIVVYLSCRDEMLGEHWHDYGIDDDDSLP